ncbi:MAG: 16S rRNA (guanine(966)-N(2))-methyltransferase RsmD [Gammaproteobacteria bacterium]|nr:16S rRNA (guanine(966)-N(2))-methyltransferase RsmD [Gammaproteobacteria bacterium]
MPRKQSHQLRIIAGKWRSRKISVLELAEIRPTPDRVRETLFNWLSPVIDGAYCLDLFAGSGALSFEALSRGAKHVVMVDKSPMVIESLRTTAQELGADNITLYQGHAPEKVILPKEPFDIIFLDPPFNQDLINGSCEWLIKNKLIHEKTYVYVEMEKENETFNILPYWHILKEGKTKQIKYFLFRPKIKSST